MLHACQQGHWKNQHSTRDVYIRHLIGFFYPRQAKEPMASLSFLATTSSPLYHPQRWQSPAVAATSPARRSYTYCRDSSSYNANTTNTGGDDGKPSVFDRRNVLLGVGGLYAGAVGLGRGNVAVGAPIEIPDLTKCQPAEEGTKVGPVQCCPNYTMGEIIDFKFPSSSKPLRVRKPVHKLTTDEIAKYKKAIAALKALPETDPRSYMNTANVHCQYCNGAYYQKGYESNKVLLQVHNGWLFLPWHRFYLHFYERILGSLINDDSFGLPFWNWDTPDGMYMPDIFVDTNSPLYDDNRNHNHYPPALLNYKYSYGTANPSTKEEIQTMIDDNLCDLYTIFRETLPCPGLFMGAPVIAGEENETTSTDGRMESLHNIMHMWSGPDESPHTDMGNFFSAARDCLFFSHHSNVDRVWEIFRKKRNYKLEITDSDWLDSAFVFVDENKQLNKVTFKQCLDTSSLRYAFQDVALPWDNKEICTKVKTAAKSKATGSNVTVSEFGSSPRTLDSTIRVLVARPKTSRTTSEKESAVEVLVISGIQDSMGESSRFDVFITTTVDTNQAGPYLGDFVGSYVRLPHSMTTSSTGKTRKSNLKLGITFAIEDLGAEAATNLVVSLVPRTGTITIGGVSIALESTA